ncbi:ParB N-terminal domain-containing protein [Paenibacillus agricola]|uniref:Uncharacterized protein n=1 Tax=Paenibacillus agricola TaxID=2716264 RepID=A0ABX0JEK5_9BACL|nr:ParB N-terminal domain-containing protein [Paenibacillus agricola]NHN34972.1 hypothetical protein [Paenibacillus agricola]
MSEDVASFDPTKHKYAYNLSKFTCFRKLTGKCSLDLSKDEVARYAVIEGVDHRDKYRNHQSHSVHYCRLLAESIKLNGVTEYVWIHSSSCGHYSFTWGQHRTCIAKTIGIKDIPALIGSAWESECRVCYFIKTNPIFRLKHWFNMTEEFIR